VTTERQKLVDDYHAKQVDAFYSECTHPVTPEDKAHNLKLAAMLDEAAKEIEEYDKLHPYEPPAKN